jgi:hypothetical protein
MVNGRKSERFKAALVRRRNDRPRFGLGAKSKLELRNCLINKTQLTVIFKPLWMNIL